MSWVKSCSQFSVEFEEGKEATPVFAWLRNRDTFHGMCVVVLSKYSEDASRDVAVIGQLLTFVGPSVSLVALVGGPHVLRNMYIEFSRSVYREKMVEYPTIDLRLLKSCLLKCASVVFGSLAQSSMTEFIIVRLKGAEHKEWMAPRHALRRAVVTGDLSMPSLVELVGHILGVWPLIVSFLKDT